MSRAEVLSVTTGFNEVPDQKIVYYYLKIAEHTASSRCSESSPRPGKMVVKQSLLDLKKDTYFFICADLIDSSLFSCVKGMLFRSHFWQVSPHPPPSAAQVSPSQRPLR